MARTDAKSVLLKLRLCSVIWNIVLLDVQGVVLLTVGGVLRYLSVQRSKC